jgi:hypothetical protein
LPTPPNPTIVTTGVRASASSTIASSSSRPKNVDARRGNSVDRSFPEEALLTSLSLTADRGDTCGLELFQDVSRPVPFANVHFP